MRCAMWESAVAKFELSAARHCKGGKRSMPRVLWLHRSEEHTSELQSRLQLVCRLLLETKTPGPNAIGFGLVATLGANWQIESGEIGYVRRRSHVTEAIGLADRLGYFPDLGGMDGHHYF